MIKLRSSTEQSTFVITVAFLDTAGAAVAPKLAQWTLKDEDGNIVNSRHAVNIDTPGTTVYIVLTDADLALPDTAKPKRYILVEAVYDSVLYGNDLHLRDEGQFSINDLKSL